MKKKLRIKKNKLGNIVKLFQNRDADNIKEIYISEILHKKKKGCENKIRPFHKLQ